MNVPGSGSVCGLKSEGTDIRRHYFRPGLASAAVAEKRWLPKCKITRVLRVWFVVRRASKLERKSCNFHLLITVRDVCSQTAEFKTLNSRWLSLIFKSFTAYVQLRATYLNLFATRVVSKSDFEIEMSDRLSHNSLKALAFERN